MRRILFPSLAFAAIVIAEPAFAQNAASSNYNVSWSALNPGNDWAAQVIQSLFPMYGAGSAPSTGNEATVIGQIVAQFTGFVAAIACAFVCYNVLMNIHRAAESSRILGSGQSWMFVPRVGFAAIMMFPLGNGFSAGQGLVYQSAMWGVGMAKVLYQNAINAVGPDAMVIAQPMIPGTEEIVLGLVQNELCMDLVNLAANTNNMVPTPGPITGTYPSGGGYVTWNYALSTDNQSGSPACGTVTIQTPASNQMTIAGQPVDMAAVQQAALNDVLTGTIRASVQQVAQNLWQNKTAASLTPLQGLLTSATQAYTSELTSAATSIQSSINTALTSQAQQARDGNIDLLKGEIQQSSLGWTGAGAYYLEIAKANATTLSLLSATPVITPPSYDGLGTSLGQDIAPVAAASQDFLNSLRTAVQTQDPNSPPSGVPQTLAGTQANQSQSLLTRLFQSMDLTTPLLNAITGYITPTSTMWTDPFGGLMSMGQTLIITSLIGFGTAALLSSTTVSTGSAIFNFLTGNWGAAAATIAGNAIMSFLATPVFIGLLALMIPGIMIAYVLPMIPWVLWMAGVCGWIILVCEAMIAVPLWMLAHMTVGGDGLHGRAIEGWALLFNVVFRPTLMVIGLFLGYFVFACMSYLIRQTFGIAAGFALSNGWLVTNFLGVAVLLNIFVMMHITAALMSFRLVALMPHHLPRLLGFTAANRVDTEAFASQAAWGPGSQLAEGSRRALLRGGQTFRTGMAQLNAPSQGRISGPVGDEAAGGGMDSTLRATTDTGGPQEGANE
jgi:conjugal transfer/type IV secretion protein DotA/TraY